MRKVGYIVIAIGVGVLLITLAFMLLPGEGELPPDSRDQFPSVTFVPPAGGEGPTRPVGGTVVIGTPQGGVEVTNFYADPAREDRYTVFIDETPKYVIAYLKEDSSFLIIINGRPFDNVRAEAESAFLQRLDVSKEDACKLSVVERVPYSVDSGRAGRDFPLSFCAAD